MKKKITFAVLLLAAIGGSAVYFTQFYPEQAEMRELEKLVSAGQMYGDQQAEEKLSSFSPGRLRILAEKGNPAAQYQLGYYYFNKKQEKLAEEWFSKAVAQKYIFGYRSLSAIYNKKGLKELAKTYMKEASDAGDNAAKIFLAMDAINHDNDFLTGYMLVEQAAKAGYPMAEATLGRWYFDGNDNIQPDWEKAFYWLDKAYKSSQLHHQPAVFKQIEKGRIFPNSVYRELAILYLLGVGTPRDETKAAQLLEEHNEQTKDKLTLLGVKAKLIKLKDKAPLQAVDKIEALQLEMESSQDPEAFLALGESLKYSDETKAKFYYGEACDLRSQEGCDKYRELNEKEMDSKK